MLSMFSYTFFSSKVKSSKLTNSSKPAGEASKKSAHHKSSDKEGLLIDFDDKKQQGEGAWEADWEDEAWESLNKDD
jgi:hypothetical protein